MRITQNINNHPQTTNNFCSNIMKNIKCEKYDLIKHQK